MAFVAVGAPIEVDKVEKATQQQINGLHARYVEELKKLFDDHRERFGVPESARLNIF